MKKLLLASAMFLTAFSSQAARVQFDFDVLSSGSSIYPCNAGIKHKEPRGQVCYNPNTYESCNPGDRGPRGPHGLIEGIIGQAETGRPPGPPQNDCGPNGENCDCVCTGEMDGDHEATIDFLDAEVTLWKDHGDPQGNSWSTRVEADGHNDHFFNTVVPRFAQFSKRLKNLEVNLSSERYGAEYFVDICYRATQIDFGQNFVVKNEQEDFDFYIDTETATEVEGNDVQGLHTVPKYKFERKVTVSDLKPPGAYTGDIYLPGVPTWSNDSYQELANLKVKSEIFCRNKGSYHGYAFGSEYADLSGQDTVNFGNEYKQADLAGCIVRYSFKESTHGRDAIDTVRRWKLHGANICTDTAITSKHLD